MKILKNFSPKFAIILICAFIAAIATFPYGFRFAHSLENYNLLLFLGVGGFFGLTSLFANMALGSYSLLNADPKQKLVNPYYLGIGSILSAIPPGFMCYFGFEKHLPFFINVPLSVVVVMVNAGISYTAIYNFLSDVVKERAKELSDAVKLTRQLGFLIGLCVSITIYVVTSHGMVHLVEGLGGDPKLASYIGYVAGILSWIPFAALYTNSTKMVTEEIYIFITKKLSKITAINKMDLLLVIVAIGSGSAFTQIAMDFFDPAKDIPTLFKKETIQLFIYDFIVPCAFFSSAAVNYLALRRLAERLLAK